MLYIFICTVHITIVCITLKNIGVKCKIFVEQLRECESIHEI